MRPTEHPPTVERNEAPLSRLAAVRMKPAPLLALAILSTLASAQGAVHVVDRTGGPGSSFSSIYGDAHQLPRTEETDRPPVRRKARDEGAFGSRDRSRLILIQGSQIQLCAFAIVSDVHEIPSVGRQRERTRNRTPEGQPVAQTRVAKVYSLRHI